MKIELLTQPAQDGLRRWAVHEHDDDLFLDAISGNPEQWAWLCFQLRVAEDLPVWFPHGKWATIQFIEAELIHEAEQGKKRY